jgi:hypothetical protein
MSRFYASIEGQAETQATRRGGKESGIQGHIRGWDLGIKVFGSADGIDNGDIFDVYITGGSNNHYQTEPIFTVRRSLVGELVIENINNRLL